MRGVRLAIYFLIAICAGPLNASKLCTGTVGALAPNSRFSLKVGDVFNLKFLEGEGKTTAVHFLGASRLLNAEIGGYFLFDPKALQIHYVPRDRMDILGPGEQGLIAAATLEPVVRSINQEGGTCAAYAIFNCVHQLFAIHQLGNGSIVHRMSDEPSRQRLYTRINNEYYADDTHVGTESEIAAELGYVVSNLDSSSPRALADAIRHSSNLGWPMLIRFDVGSKMSQTPYVILNHETGGTAERRLWLPRDETGSSGGHQIMVVRSFVDLSGREWLVVVDSNWQAPRLWSIQELNRSDLARIRGWTLWQNQPNPSNLPEPPRTPFILEPEGVDPSYPRAF